MKTMKKFLFILLLSCAFLLSISTGALSLTIDFDDLTPGTVVDTIQGVTFSSNIVGYDLVVSDQFDTTSGENYLGVADDGFEVFLPNDILTLTFSIPVYSLSVNFISSPNTPGGVFGIETFFGSSFSGTAPTTTLADNGEVFSVNFSSITPFTSADLTSLNDSSIYSYNIDDISFAPVPEPCTLVLVGTGLGLVAFVRRKRMF